MKACEPRQCPCKRSGSPAPETSLVQHEGLENPSVMNERVAADGRIGGERRWDLLSFTAPTHRLSYRDVLAVTAGLDYGLARRDDAKQKRVQGPVMPLTRREMKMSSHRHFRKTWDVHCCSAMASVRQRTRLTDRNQLPTARAPGPEINHGKTIDSRSPLHSTRCPCGRGCIRGERVIRRDLHHDQCAGDRHPGECQQRNYVHGDIHRQRYPLERKQSDDDPGLERGNDDPDQQRHHSGDQHRHRPRRADQRHESEHRDSKQRRRHHLYHGQ